MKLNLFIGWLFSPLVDMYQPNDMAIGNYAYWLRPVPEFIERKPELYIVCMAIILREKYESGAMKLLCNTWYKIHIQTNCTYSNFSISLSHSWRPTFLLEPIMEYHFLCDIYAAKSAYSNLKSRVPYKLLTSTNVNWA